MAQIEQIVFLPPMAVARLGGSAMPLDAFTWIEDPSLHGGGLTVISPTITLVVQTDGSVRPVRPSTIAFRDGGLLRPVAPFFELWAKVQGENDLQPLNLALLESNGAGPESISFTVTAANRKAARRTGDNACAYSASITVVGTDHDRHELLAASSGERALVDAERPIHLGTFQVILAKANRTDMGIDLSLIRVRYTPARGEVYGPPGVNGATDPDSGRQHPLVPARNRILNTGSAWTSYDASDARFDSPQPADTYDGADDPGRRNVSFGIVDDTCDVVIKAVAAINNNRLTAESRVFCGPPDFAPDRRPFISLADDLIDRDPPPGDAPELIQDALDRLGDLFQRAYETASLANLDATRDTMMSGQDASRFPPSTTLPESMTKRDSSKFFDRNDDLTAASEKHELLPYASLAHDVHLSHIDVEDMVMLLQSKPDFVRRLIRPPYGSFSEMLSSVSANAAPAKTHRDPRVDRDGLFDMRMPPYMRDSDASPLSLTRRQYKFLMSVLDRLQKPAPVDTVPAQKGARRGRPSAPAKVRTAVRAHVERVAQRRRPGGPGQNP